MAEHTPGPWYLDTSDWPLIVNPKAPRDNRVLATIPLPKGSTGTDKAGKEAVANAKLMRAAPELFAVLCEAVVLILECNCESACDGTCTWAKAKAAIKVATGYHT